MIACFISNEGMLRAAIAIELVREGAKEAIPVGLHFLDGVPLVEEGGEECGIVCGG